MHLAYSVRWTQNIYSNRNSPLFSQIFVGRHFKCWYFFIFFSLICNAFRYDTPRHFNIYKRKNIQKWSWRRAKRLRFRRKTCLLLYQSLFDRSAPRRGKIAKLDSHVVRELPPPPEFPDLCIRPWGKTNVTEEDNNDSDNTALQNLSEDAILNATDSSTSINDSESSSSEMERNSWTYDPKKEDWESRIYRDWSSILTRKTSNQRRRRSICLRK